MCARQLKKHVRRKETKTFFLLVDVQNDWDQTFYGLRKLETSLTVFDRGTSPHADPSDPGAWGCWGEAAVLSPSALPKPGPLHPLAHGEQLHPLAEPKAAPELYGKGMSFLLGNQIIFFFFFCKGAVSGWRDKMLCRQAEEPQLQKIKMKITDKKVK